MGAGTSGATLAFLLHQTPIQVTLFERAEAARVDGCGVLLRGETLDDLEKAQLHTIVNSFETAGNYLSAFEYYTLSNVLRHAAPKHSTPTGRSHLLIRRGAVLEPFLQPYLQLGGDLRLNAKIVDVHQTAHDVTVTFSNGQSWTGDVVIGADGIFSTIAKHIVPERELHYLGDRVWRGIARDGDLVQDAKMKVWCRESGVYANAFDLGKDENGQSWTHWGLFQERPYPTEAKEREELRNQGIPNEMLSVFPESFTRLVNETGKDKIVEGYTFDFDPQPRYVNGRLGVIGDAAHAMCSTLSWGMGSGISDALCLAICLQEEKTWEDALRRYEKARMETTHGYQTASRNVSVQARKSG